MLATFFNISETITTSKDVVLTPFGSVTFRVDRSVKKTKLEYLLPFRRYSTGSKSPERDISLFLFLFLKPSKKRCLTVARRSRDSDHCRVTVHDFIFQKRFERLKRPKTVWFDIVGRQSKTELEYSRVPFQRYLTGKTARERVTRYFFLFFKAVRSAFLILLEPFFVKFET